MQFKDGSQEPQGELIWGPGDTAPQGRQAGSLARLREVVAQELERMQEEEEASKLGPMPQSLTPEEQDRIADGEPYCFRCGKPASSFSEYGDFTGTEGSIAGDRAAYVRNEEGTYNPATNRFACDACYIAIGMPAGPGGWQAP